MTKFPVRHISLLLLILLCTLQETIAAREDNYIFKQLSVADKFPAYIHTVNAAQNGIIWIGTKNGLGKFDGYELREYVHKDDDTQSIPDNEVVKILEDSLHNIWILTNKGLAKYISQTDNFHIPKTKKGENIIVNSVRNVQGGVIFGAQNKVYFYDYKTGELQDLLSFKTAKDYFIYDIWQWDNNSFLCLDVWQGLLLIDTKNKTIKPSPFDKLKNISRVLLDSKGNVWCASYNEGVTCFDRQGNKIASYNTHNSVLSNDVVLCMVEHNGEIWMGTDGGGINIINLQNGKITILEHVSGDINSLPTNSIQSLYIDGNNVWAGSIRGGLINIRKSFVRSYSDATLNSNTGLSEKAILAFYQTPSSDLIWIGSDGGGINQFDPNTQTFKHYPLTWGEKITSITNYKNNELLVTIFSKGIFYFNMQSGMLRSADENNEEIRQLVRYGRKTVNLYQDEPNSALIISSSIYRYDFINNKVSLLSSKPFAYDGVILPVGHDDQYTYLYDSHQIYALNRRTSEIQVLYTDKIQFITCMARDTDGIFWIGMKDKIVCYNHKTKTQSVITNNLLKGVMSIICDNAGHVWIGTNQKLLAWVKSTGKLMAFDESDGAMKNEYINKSVLRSRDGDIYMGGVNGMIQIYESFPTTELPIPHIALSEILSNGKNVMPLVNLEKKEIKLDSNSRTITIRVMSEEDDIFRNRIYRFIISGQEEIVLDNTLPEITLHSLSPGTYKVSVLCSTKDGDWSQPSEILKFTISPPWFQSWWFLILCFAILTGMIILGIVMYVNHKKNQLTLVMQKHTQQVYEDKVNFLININHELRTPLTLIYAPLSQIINSISSNDMIFEPIKSAFKQSKRMKELLNMTLNLRKMEVNDNKINIHPYHLNLWIKELASDYAYEEMERQITITYDLSPAIAEVDLDKDKNIIIITNLLDNAFKYSPQGSTLQLKTELVRNNEFVRISVIDEGVGLSGVIIEKLFDRFYQGNNSKGGIGIGLSYAKILVEQHKGVIGAYSNENGGACFYYELPIKQNTKEETTHSKEFINELLFDTNGIIEEQTSLVNLIDTHKYSLLFVDDNEELQEFIVQNLKDKFRQLFIASNGEEALNIALREIPDVIISDVMMPVMNGYELCKNIKTNQNINHIQVILLTARTDEQSHLDGYQTGADAYFEKPVEIEILLASLKNRLFLREQIKMRYSSNSVPTDPKIHITSSDDTFLYKLDKIINENIKKQDLNINFICREIGMSRASLYNKLKQLTDMGANEYINRIRTDKAISFLTQTDMSISDIAIETGFSSSKYFSTVFKLYTEKTPSQYKDEYKTSKGK